MWEAGKRVAKRSGLCLLGPISMETKETGLILGSVVLVKSASFSFLENGSIVDE